MIRLGDVVTIARGTTYKSALKGQPGPVLLGLGSIHRNGGFRGEKLETYGGDSPEKILVKPGELYASLKDVTQSADLLGAVARLPVDGPVGRLTQDTVRLDIKDKSFPADYLYWVLRTPQYRAYCRSHLTGTTNLGLPREDFLAFAFPEPDDHTVKLAATLSALDDKIESNQRIQSLSLSLARALFDKSLNSSATSRLSDIATVVLGGTPSKSEAAFWGGQEISWINSGAANQEVILTPTEYITSLGLQNSAAKLMPKGATVLAITGATLGQVAILGIETAGNQSLVGIWGSSPESNAWIHFAIQTRINELLTHATGAAQQHVNKQNVEQLAVPVLSPGELEKWGRGVVPLVERAVSAPAESLRLAALRDALLPELLSGRVRVGEAAK